MKLTDDVSAVVTGAASGLGEAMARKLASLGVKVTIFDVNEDAGQTLADEIGGVFAAVDVSDAQSVTDGFKSARQAHGQERVLFNCAGIAPGMKTVSRGQAHDPATFIKTININLIGTFHAATQAAEGMAALDPLETNERGLIVNTTSIAAFEGQIGQIAYAASKGGIVGMTLPMARDLAGLGIRVMTIAPGIFHTPILDGFTQELRDQLAAQIPFPDRLGDPDEFAELGVHICENAMLNGSVIRLDGAVRLPPK